ncbi:hypothetical protein [Flavobacterium sp. 140616W15]|uniref:hypothetical protein n=1 Tax=Flavobacterium sp. 140616W15 TaxID=2478552 RepID=UPI000F0BE790|nr:hypothetical protein [Flavobacterium sp. 140616W15]AYN04688.1 hypothetical protein EAG11_11325 [Flavobacterium sp. 140616W15]
MNIKPTIIKEYLQSLKEDNELDVIFTILLQTLEYEILSTPKEYKGFSQYGKDIVTVRIDPTDGVKKRFYFELKAGDIDSQKWNMPGNGVRDTLTMTVDADFKTTYKDFDKLPIKVILVFNGMVSEKIRTTLNGFSQKEFIDKGFEFEEWNIFKISELLSNEIFNKYLLINDENIRLFNRVLVNLNVVENVSNDFDVLIDNLLFKNSFSKKKGNLNRKQKLIFQSINLIAYIIYTESKNYNNLSIAKKYLTHLILKYWFWILKNKLDTSKEIIGLFNQFYKFYNTVIEEYLERNLRLLELKDGLYYEDSGRYEQIGYTTRSFDFIVVLNSFIFSIKDKIQKEEFKGYIDRINNTLQNNNVLSRPLLDIHSIPIIDSLNLLIYFGDKEFAKQYLMNVLGYLKFLKKNYNKFPDAANNIKSVIKYTVTSVKPVYYIDSISPLLAVLMEYIVILDLEQTYYDTRKFVIENDITLGLFVPHQGINSNSKHLIEDCENDLEEQLFSKSVFDGYQIETNMFSDFNKELSYEDFKKKLLKRKDEFQYEYKTDKCGFSSLRTIAHYYYKTPYFPDYWRNHIN